MKKVLSYLLACCLLAGMLPCMEGSIFASAAETNMIESEAELKAAITSAPKGQLANLYIGSFTIKEPIEIPEDKEIRIYGTSKASSGIQPTYESTWDSSKVGLFILGKNASLTLEKLTIDGDKKARCILVNEGGSALSLKNVTIQNGASTQYSGVAIHASGKSEGKGNTLTILEGCTFENNKTSKTSPTSGGAIYLGSGSTLVMRGTVDNPICFWGNEAHSGACIYAYKAYVYAEHCKFGFGEAENQRNKAGQRGGALHCHGTMVLKDCTITNNSSGQYGGGLYISASSGDYDGVAVLDNTTITGNAAQKPHKTTYQRGHGLDNRYGDFLAHIDGGLGGLLGPRYRLLSHTPLGGLLHGIDRFGGRFYFGCRVGSLVGCAGLGLKHSTGPFFQQTGTLARLGRLCRGSSTAGGG